MGRRFPEQTGRVIPRNVRKLTNSGVARVTGSSVACGVSESTTVLRAPKESLPSVKLGINSAADRTCCCHVDQG